MEDGVGIVCTRIFFIYVRCMRNLTIYYYLRYRCPSMDIWCVYKLSSNFKICYTRETEIYPVYLLDARFKNHTDDLSF